MFASTLSSKTQTKEQHFPLGYIKNSITMEIHRVKSYHDTENTGHTEFLNPAGKKKVPFKARNYG